MAIDKTELLADSFQPQFTTYLGPDIPVISDILGIYNSEIFITQLNQLSSTNNLKFTEKKIWRRSHY